MTNSEIVNRCRKLNEYSLFVAKVREFLDNNDDILKAIRDAVKYCQKHDILKEYLEKHETEVINMLFYEYNQELEREVIREEAIEEGIHLGELRSDDKWQGIVADKEAENEQLRLRIAELEAKG